MTNIETILFMRIIINKFSLPTCGVEIFRHSRLRSLELWTEGRGATFFLFAESQQKQARASGTVQTAIERL